MHAYKYGWLHAEMDGSAFEMLTLQDSISKLWFSPKAIRTANL